jgi:PAS domain S-box-containing protein
MTQGLRVALIDDNESDRALVKRELRRTFESVEFVEVIDREGFEHLLRENGYDVLITDYQFGWGDGMEALKMSKLRYPDCPVIMFTATANEETVADAMKSGLDDYVVKSPKHFARIPTAVRSSLEHAAARKAKEIAERRLSVTLHELHEQREWLSTILRSITSGVIATDGHGRVRLINPAAERQTGWTGGSALEKDIAEVLRLYDDSGRPVAEVPAQLALRGEANASQEHDYTLLARNGKRITVIDGASPIRDESGKVLGAVTVLRDITERKQMMRDLARSNHELQHFTYAAAHDLREPVRTVRAFTELLERLHLHELTGNGPQILSYITSAARRMEELVDGLFQYGQASNDEPNLVEVSADEVLRIVVESMRKQLDESRAKVSWGVLPQVRADRNQLGVVFQNLISNALKYHGGHAPEVKIASDDLEEEWRFCVSDNGIGIAPQHQLRIFDIFERVHPHDYPGAGIGLSVCRRLIERHGGRIWVESEEGNGSRFCFTLPKPS